MQFKRIWMPVLFLFTFAVLAAGGDSHAQGDKTPLPVFGSGAIEVRLYSDYFCPPCRKLEPFLEPILKDLLKRNSIRLILVDLPLHDESPLYGKYFLYALKSRNDADHGLHVRNVLFNAAAGKDFLTAKKIEGLFRDNKIPYKAFDTKPAFDRINALIKEDGVSRSPMCVIVTAGKKETLIGGADILAALKKLK